MGYSSRYSGGPPAWFVFLIGIALVLGGYYLFIGARDFFASGGLSRLDAEQQAAQEATATIERRLAVNALPTRRPTSTPPPACQYYLVDVPTAIVRQLPTTNSSVLESLDVGTEVCVIQQEPGTEWYLVDRNPLTQRIEPAYMRQDLLRPRDPTPTPSPTPQPLATITPTSTATSTVTPKPTETSESVQGETQPAPETRVPPATLPIDG